MWWLWILIGVTIGCVATYIWFVIKLLNCKVSHKQSTQSQTQWLPVGGGFNPNIDHPDIGYYVKPIYNHPIEFRYAHPGIIICRKCGERVE